MKSLRTGITTGVCAAAAARAAARMLLSGCRPVRVEVLLPDGSPLSVPILRCGLDTPAQATATVRKDAGDDADVTDGLEIVATVGLDGPAPAGASAVLEGGVRLIAGEGVGVVSLPGLQIGVGEPAVNPVPRQMIASALKELVTAGRPPATGSGLPVPGSCSCWVRLAIPGGRQAAQKTFNPRLGVREGLSILGTTGIVRPYSVQAVRDTIRCAIGVAAACGIARPVLCPGNIGTRAAGRHLALCPQQVIEVSNEWGWAMDCLPGHGFDAVLVLGHPGKLGKLAAGQWDTHSSRSAPAVEWVATLARDLLACPLLAAGTVEGLFASLAPPDRRRLGDELAGRVAQAVRERLRGTALPGGTGVPPVCTTGILSATGAIRRGEPVDGPAFPARETKEQQQDTGGTPMLRELDVAVMLIDMRGDELGASGKVNEWRTTRPQ